MGMAFGHPSDRFPLTPSPFLMTAECFGLSPRG